MSTRFFTNEDHNTLLKKFEGVFTHNRDVQFFDALLVQKKENPEADVSALEAEIDQLVYKLYDLTPAEIDIIEGKS